MHMLKHIALTAIMFIGHAYAHTAEFDFHDNTTTYHRSGLIHFGGRQGARFGNPYIKQTMWDDLDVRLRNFIFMPEFQIINWNDNETDEPVVEIIPRFSFARDDFGFDIRLHDVSFEDSDSQNMSAVSACGFWMLNNQYGDFRGSLGIMIGTQDTQFIEGWVAGIEGSLFPGGNVRLTMGFEYTVLRQSLLVDAAATLLVLGMGGIYLPVYEDEEIGMATLGGMTNGYIRIGLSVGITEWFAGYSMGSYDPEEGPFRTLSGGHAGLRIWL